MRNILVLFATAIAAAGAHPWACFHGDPQHTGRSPYVVGAPLVLSAVGAQGGELSGSPVVRADGAVLVGARDVRLYCWDPRLTSPLWSADLTPYGSSIYFSTPALDDSGNAYITTNRRLVKVGPAGDVLWAWPGNNSLSISHSPVIGRDGKVYFAGYSDTLYALNPDSTLAWARPLGAAVNAAPALGPDGRIYVATTRDSLNHELWCFDPDGSSPWAFGLAADAEFASPAVGPDTVVYVGAGRYLYAVRPGGTLKWRDSLSAQIQSCPAVANESTLYVVAGARLYCVSTNSGVRWRKSIGGSNYCSPAVDAAGNIYVGSADGANSTFYCIAPDSTVRDSRVLGDDIWSSPAIGDSGRVYVGSMNDSLYLFLGMGPGVAEAERGGAARQATIEPNPTTGRVRIAGAPGVRVRRVFDVLGHERSVACGPGGADLSALPAGTYFLELGGDRTRELRKVVRR